MKRWIDGYSLPHMKTCLTRMSQLPCHNLPQNLMSPHTGGFWIFPAAVTVNGSKKMRNGQNNMDSAELEGVGRVVEKMMHYAPTVLQGAPAAFAFRLETPSRFLFQGLFGSNELGSEC